ncbi:MAG: MerR family transcriptional regulator [Candidatus Dechloromonas phosphoritropha]|nr:MerR family transcriptional regulator [Candidatus Dechloromonas phosphoritropha]MBP9226889.1 MerR family transcriptional regulator [Azonexus sp.]
MNNPNFNIAAVERDTGLSKDVLRVWERRYGFPAPDRDDHGERSYPAEQVERLRLVKRLMDAGHRPGKLLSTPPEELNALAPRRPEPPAVISGATNPADLGDLLALIKQHDGAAYQQAMQQRLARQGLDRFVQDTVAPLARRVGEAWEDGSVEVFEEHLFTEMTKRVLRQAIASLPGGMRGPRIVLTSVPEEPHVLGLLMAEALFALEGAECIPLGTQMPLLEIARAAAAHRAEIVALSFSVAFPKRQIPGLLQQLRMVLPETVALWAGGGGVRRLPSVAGVELLDSLEHSLAALESWRRKRM